MEAFYIAHEREPSNPQIVASMKSGMRVVVLDPKTPSDVLDFFVDIGNEDNSKSICALVDIMVLFAQLGESSSTCVNP